MTALPPTSFVDRKGRVWDLTLTIAGAKRIDNSDFSEIHPDKFSILNPDKEGKFYTEILMNPSLVIAMVWAITYPQAEEHGITEADFLESLDGVSVRKLREAFWESLRSFFQETRIGPTFPLTQALRLQRQVAELEEQVEVEAEEKIKVLIKEEAERQREIALAKLKTLAENHGES